MERRSTPATSMFSDVHVETYSTRNAQRESPPTSRYTLVPKYSTHSQLPGNHNHEDDRLTTHTAYVPHSQLLGNVHNQEDDCHTAHPTTSCAPVRFITATIVALLMLGVIVFRSAGVVGGTSVNLLQVSAGADALMQVAPLPLLSSRWWVARLLSAPCLPSRRALRRFVGKGNSRREGRHKG